MTKLAALAGCLMLVVGWSTAAAADETQPPPFRPSILLSISSPLSETRDAAFDRAMKEPGPPARRPDGEIQPDGSVCYGAMTITVRNPCPPGTHYELPPLPGPVRK